MRYRILTLRDNENSDPTTLVKNIEKNRGLIGDHDNKVFGVFGSLLGLATNEVYLVTFGEDDFSLDLDGHIKIASSRTFKPTARPTIHQPAKEAGIYVFRWFNVDPAKIDEIVRLSADAWPSFESSFETRVQGLFAEDTDAPLTMLLVTWYANLTVWEQSRHPPPEAKENFLRRHKLTLSALPVATRLIPIAQSGSLSKSKS